MNEFNEYVREGFSVVGDVIIKSMMGGYLVYFNGKLIGDICNNERTDFLLAQNCVILMMVQRR